LVPVLDINKYNFAIISNMIRRIKNLHIVWNSGEKTSTVFVRNIFLGARSQNCENRLSVPSWLSLYLSVRP